MQDERDKVDGIVVVPEQSEEYLNQRQLEDYHSFRKQLLRWLLNLGKDPEKAEGYAFDTARQRSYKLDQFYRWIWRREDGYTLRVTTDHTDKYCKELVYEELSKTHKAAVQKAIKSLFKYLNHERGRSIDWEPEIKFSSGGTTHQIRDFLTGDERRKIKQASLEQEGVEHVFGLPGEEMETLLFALEESDVTFVPTRREQGAAFMADIHGRLTGEAGVCPATLGPGATNLLTGVADAHLDRSPVVAITAQGGLERLHKESHQAIDVVDMFDPVTKWNARLNEANIVHESVRKAFKTAEYEKPGAPHLELPEDHHVWHRSTHIGAV